MSTNDKELEERLTNVARGLLQLVSSPDKLLIALDRVEGILQRVEQSPSVSMQTALSPMMKALVAEELMKHPNVDVKVSVASCISEITRITAPDAPYDDDIMKDVCQLIVSSFENLSDTSSRSYKKRITILETVAKVRSCILMLDLECDQMIIQMFQHFLKAISDNHAEVVFGSMETIMTLLLEESEDTTSDLLNPILATLKINGEDVMPIAKKLAEKVIQNSANRVRPCLAQAVKSLDADLDDFGEVVASVGRGTTDPVKNSNESFSRDQLVVERKSASASQFQDQVTQVASEGREDADFQEKKSTSIVSNDIAEACGEEIVTDVNSSGKADSNDQAEAKSMSSAQNTMKSELEDEHSGAEEVACNHEFTGKDVPIPPTKAKPAKSSDKVEDTTTQLSPSQTSVNEGSRSDSEADSLDQIEKLGDASKKLGDASKKLGHASKKRGDASKKREDGSSMTKDDTNKSGRMKPTLGKDDLKSSAGEFHAKDNVTPPVSPLKSLKDKDIFEETQRTSSKKKRTRGTGKPSDTIVYDQNLVGSKVKVWWPEDKMYYEGVITSFNSAKKKHKVSYNDGDEEILNLRKERWQFVEDDSDSDGKQDAGVEHSSHTSSEMKTKKKKRHTNSETPKSSKRQKTDGSSKSKTNDTATKSSGKSNNDSKMKSESKDNKNSKLSMNSNQGSVKSKGETYSGKPRGRPPKIIKTSSSSKVKVTDSDEEIPEDAVKLLTPDKAKSREREGKIGGKRKR